MIRSALAALAIVAAAPAAAHQLNVFAFVEGADVHVEAKFTTGRIPVAGEIRVFDAEETLLTTLPLAEGGVTTFPLDRDAAAEGLMIEVEVGEGHEDYWLLTPADIARGEATN